MKGAEMVIDCHGHFTTEPPAFLDYRSAQIAYLSGRGSRPDRFPGIEDGDLVAAIGDNQLRIQRERGTDVTLLSPRASAMGHHLTDQDIADEWARASNDVVLRIGALYPENFIAVCQLPQIAGGELAPMIDELERCVDAGVVGFNLNPDPSGGEWSGPSLADEWWDPLWSAMERLRVPGMIHASGACSPAVHTTGAHYLAVDTIAFMQLLQGNVFQRFPGVRLVIPHGGGAVPYHWGRFRGLAIALKVPALEDHLLQNLYFDSCVYHQPGIDLLFDVIGAKNVVFGSEVLGAVKAKDPVTGFPFDDTLRYVESSRLTSDEKSAVLASNARVVYPRLDERLRAQGR